MYSSVNFGNQTVLQRGEPERSDVRYRGGRAPRIGVRFGDPSVASDLRTRTEPRLNPYLDATLQLFYTNWIY